MNEIFILAIWYTIKHPTPVKGWMLKVGKPIA
jgi:hypothetical protein